jgi:putative endonuclease
LFLNKNYTKLQKILLILAMNNHELGKHGEDLALDYYLENGYELLEQNFNYYIHEKVGELDLIMLKNNKLYLVEVKTRSNTSYGEILEQITRKKLKCIYKSYQGFLKKYPGLNEYFVQFDVVTVLGDKVTIYPDACSFEGIFG